MNAAAPRQPRRNSSSSSAVPAPSLTPNPSSRKSRRLSLIASAKDQRDSSTNIQAIPVPDLPPSMPQRELSAETTGEAHQAAMMYHRQGEACSHLPPYMPRRELSMEEERAQIVLLASSSSAKAVAAALPPSMPRRLQSLEQTKLQQRQSRSSTPPPRVTLLGVRTLTSTSQPGASQDLPPRMAVPGYLYSPAPPPPPPPPPPPRDEEPGIVTPPTTATTTKVGLPAPGCHMPSAPLISDGSISMVSDDMLSATSNFSELSCAALPIVLTSQDLTTACWGPSSEVVPVRAAPLTCE